MLQVDESDTHHCKESSSKDESCSHGCAGGHENLFIEGDGTEGYRQDGITTESSVSGKPSMSTSVASIDNGITVKLLIVKLRNVHLLTASQNWMV